MFFLTPCPISSFLLCISPSSCPYKLLYIDNPQKFPEPHPTLDTLVQSCCLPPVPRIEPIGLPRGQRKVWAGGPLRAGRGNQLTRILVSVDRGALQVSPQNGAPTDDPSGSPQYFFAGALLMLFLRPGDSLGVEARIDTELRVAHGVVPLTGKDVEVNANTRRQFSRVFRFCKPFIPSLEIQCELLERVLLDTGEEEEVQDADEGVQNDEDGGQNDSEDDGDDGSDSEYKDDEGTSEESPSSEDPNDPTSKDASAALTLPEISTLRDRVRIAMQAKGISNFQLAAAARIPEWVVPRFIDEKYKFLLSRSHAALLDRWLEKEESVSLSSLLRMNFTIPRASGNSRPTTIHRVAKMYIKRHKRYLISEGTSHGRSSWHCKGCDFKLAIRAGMRQLQTVNLRAPWHEEGCRYFEEEEGVWGASGKTARKKPLQRNKLTTVELLGKKEQSVDDLVCDIGSSLASMEYPEDVVNAVCSAGAPITLEPFIHRLMCPHCMRQPSYFRQMMGQPKVPRRFQRSELWSTVRSYWLHVRNCYAISVFIKPEDREHTNRTFLFYELFTDYLYEIAGDSGKTKRAEVLRGLQDMDVRKLPFSIHHIEKLIQQSMESPLEYSSVTRGRVRKVLEWHAAAPEYKTGGCQDIVDVRSGEMLVCKKMGKLWVRGDEGEEEEAGGKKRARLN